jgi:hypothetical protein
MRILGCLVAAGGPCGRFGFLLCENLPEVGSQPFVVTGKHLVQGALVLVRGSSRELPAPGGFGFIHFGFHLKISHHVPTPRNATQPCA